MAKTQEFITLKDHKDNRRKDFNLELSNKDKTLNKRSELFTKCRHRNKDHKDKFWSKCRHRNKDHKDNFESNPKCRLINPSKSELGKVSKVILDNISNRLREKLKVNQWKNSNSVINWFNSIKNKPSHTFSSFDIVEFYPSITEKLLDNVITWAKTLTNIPDDYITIIKHAHKSLLFYQDKAWVKKNHESLFDVTMRSYGGVEV